MFLFNIRKYYNKFHPLLHYNAYLSFDFFRGHKKTDAYCQSETNPNLFPELKPVNSVVCEQTFSFTNHYANLKAMNPARYNMFWLYILDLHYHYVEDPCLLKMNPLSPVRMKTILDKLLEKEMKKIKI